MGVYAKDNPEAMRQRSHRSALAERIARKEQPDIYYSKYSSIRKNNGGGLGSFSSTAWILAGGTEEQVEDYKKQAAIQAKAQSDTIVVESSKPTLTAEDRERYRGILGPAVKQSVDATTQERNKPSGLRQSQNIWLTEIEENIAAKANDYKCFGCGYEYGSYTDVGNKHYEKVDPEQMHVAKTRKMGGTKEDVRLGCGTCNDIHGNGEGMPDADFKAMIKKAHEERGYRNVRLTEVTA